MTAYSNVSGFFIPKIKRNKMIKITDFNGMIPKVASRNKDMSIAEVAENVDLSQGTLKPFRQPLHIADIDESSSNNSLFMTDCCVVTGDCHTRLATFGVLCDEIVVATDLLDYPVYSKTNVCPFEWQPLAFECDLSAPMVSTGSVNTDFTMESRSYIYTLVNDMGWESQPSYPSQPIRCNTKAMVNVSGLPSGQRVRVYRSAVDLDFGVEQPEETFGDYLLVGETTNGNFVDNGRVGGRACVTYDYKAPPNNLREIQSWREGRLAGLSNNVFMMTERNLPYAWNDKYNVTFYDKAIALICTNNLGYVLTDGKPVVLELRGECEKGSPPVVVTEIVETLPIISKQSACEYMGGVVYASHDGLVLLSRNTATIITQNHYSIEQWRKLEPHTMKGIVYQGYYYGTTNTGTIRFRLTDGVYAGEDKKGLTTLSLKPKAWFKSDTDRLYMVLDDENYKGVYQWNEGKGELPMKWISNNTTLAGVTRLSAYKLVTDESGNEITHCINRREIQRYTHKLNKPTRLPIGYHGIDWQIKITGTAEVFEYHIAPSIRELAQQ